MLEGGLSGIGNDEGREVEYPLKILRVHVQQHLHAAGDPLEIPDMGHGSGKLYMTHTLAADLRAGDFDAALFADDALVADALIPAAMALPILGRPEYALAEQTVALGL